MKPCDLSCALDGICEPLCDSPLNFCSVDEDCLLGFIEESRDLQSLQRQIQVGLQICCWTTIIVGVLCGLFCFAVCLRVDDEGGPVIHWHSLSWANSSLRTLRFIRSTNDNENESEENNNDIESMNNDIREQKKVSTINPLYGEDEENEEVICIVKVKNDETTAKTETEIGHNHLL